MPYGIAAAVRYDLIDPLTGESLSSALESALTQIMPFGPEAMPNGFALL